MHVNYIIIYIKWSLFLIVCVYDIREDDIK